jgi:hypothetical protein
MTGGHCSYGVLNLHDRVLCSSGDTVPRVSVLWGYLRDRVLCSSGGTVPGVSVSMGVLNLHDRGQYSYGVLNLHDRVFCSSGDTVPGVSVPMGVLNLHGRGVSVLTEILTLYGLCLTKSVAFSRWNSTRMTEVSIVREYST